jgi:hypothetical protein
VDIQVLFEDETICEAPSGRFFRTDFGVVQCVTLAFGSRPEAGNCVACGNVGKYSALIVTHSGIPKLPYLIIPSKS